MDDSIFVFGRRTMMSRLTLRVQLQMRGLGLELPNPYRFPSHSVLCFRLLPLFFTDGTINPSIP